TDQRQAEQWARARRLPMSVRQNGGGRVALVGLDGGRPRYLASRNVAAARATGTLLLHPDQSLGLALTGENFEIGIWDGGVPLAAHQEFVGRVAVRDGAAAEDHATHVAGTLAAAGRRADARGMAYRARLRAYDWFDDVAEMDDEAARGLRVSNHSYGLITGWHYGDLEDDGDRWYWLGDASVSTEEDYGFGAYDAEALQYDRTVFANPDLLPVVAAGNDRGDRGPRGGTYRALDDQGRWQTYDLATHPRPRDGGLDGYDTISGAALAKNVLTVGSVGPADAVSAFSSFGPVDDGRIKPDLVGFGERVLSSTAAGPTAYGLSSGTSMATPNVAGSLVLLQEHAVNELGRTLPAASLKALALHTARDLGTPGPDYRTGWGVLDARAAADHLSRARTESIALIEAALEPEASFVQEIVAEEGAALTVTLAWTDYAAAPSRRWGASPLDDPTPALANDLDVRVTAADGTTYAPFTLDPARPGAAATPGDNRVDPVEQIRVTGLPAGTYTLTVSHEGRLAAGLPQPFALLVSGATGPARPVGLAGADAVGTVEQVTLRWRTAFERDAVRFVLYRTPLVLRADGEKPAGAPVEVGTLASAGASQHVQDYTFEDPLVPAGRYRYEIVAETDGGRSSLGVVTADVPAPDAVAVLSSYPNPFAERARIVLDLPRTQQATLDVFDLLGRRVTTLLDGPLPAGRHEVAVDASGWAPGIYLARLHTPEGTRTHRMVVLR
ncbi:MAG: S8 family serine peptidase, partial [Rhodothermales bacterium]|nr:S8 family serine peptidase [Rhodothermales bacterium]